jgi:hypothetical protein
MIRRIATTWPDDELDAVFARLVCGHVIQLVARNRPWCAECSRARALDALDGRHGKALRALVQAHAAHGALAVQTDWTQEEHDGS